MKNIRSSRWTLLSLAAAAALLTGAGGALLGVCGPFTDVTDATFCPFVLEIFTLGITTGTTPTTYAPNDPVSRLQMAAFLSRTVDGVLKRGSRRAALDQFWTTQLDSTLGLTTLGGDVGAVKSDGADLWVGNIGANSVQRVRASDGKLLETWTGATRGASPLIAMGRVFVTGNDNPGLLYRIDPTAAAGAVTTVATNLGGGAFQIAFDGARIWTANSSGSVSIVTPGATLPWTVTTVAAGLAAMRGVLYDGANIWVTSATAGTLLKLDSNAAILQTVTLGGFPLYPVFDGTNIWVPDNTGAAVSVVRASNGAILATLTGNGLNGAFMAAFDGQRVLVTNLAGGGVSLWKAADLTPIGFFSTGIGSAPTGACSDGVNFWLTLTGPDKLARF